jgi:hypothetical protein
MRKTILRRKEFSGEIVNNPSSAEQARQNYLLGDNSMIVSVEGYSNP